MTGWPTDFDGIAETVTLSPDPDGRWNVAALGVHAGVPATARTWGETVTWRNFARSGRGVVTFPEDPVLFVEAALTERKADTPDIEGVAARVEVSVSERDRGTEGGTMWVDWSMDPGKATVVSRSIPVTNRGFNAVVEMAVAASRLGVPTYDDRTLRTRLAHFAGVVETCGGDREHRALDRLRQHVDW
ncbi:DUF447 domain-containing protein [Halanaeroarchaeum sulfurireducens]|uniref:DUF447 family protein n=1 Tax=Halanaeroarchaeum sulfurireducens TaxID=1604004 RepID=A0A0F7PF69_9EURY|nr:DUF447 domain-containing protein [Halanaeroarchaeum sulfurireducens]AKH98164.1 hypothetical protein HLASF_1688 [Halanaeroarchaeum sulfurireducens]ALG82558.1 hypothetical protein HLASA_1675 [Halanaeroarchaeum sulfurireducens]